MTWEPKPGTGWDKLVHPDGGVSYALPVGPDPDRGPILFVTLRGDGDLFEIARSPKAFAYTLPGFDDIQLVELDFDVAGWSVKGFTERPGGMGILLQAVGHRSRPG